MQAIAPAPVQLTAKQLNIVKATVTRNLKDPDSAKFGEIKATKLDGTDENLTVVCGWVNARNSFGGYVGSSPFMLLLSKTAKKADVIKMGGEEMVNFQIQNRCLEKGIRL